MKRLLAIGMAAALLGACAQQGAESALIADPHEALNRDIHAFNKGLDSAIIAPASELYGHVAPAPAQEMVSNGLDHLRLPAIFINRVLQGDAEAAGDALARFTVNTTLGIGGLFDPAADHFNLPLKTTDFGVTLATWGAEEGVYHEAPFFGPSTTRHLVGRLINMAIDPVTLVSIGVVEVGQAAATIATARTPADVVNTRHENAELVDDILYGSEDSYVTARAGYVQNRRRYVAGGETDTEALPDIFD